VLFASITLAVLIFLMTGTTGLFTSKITLKAYFDDASGLRNGAPVRLQGVDIGNVTKIRVVPGKEPNPVEVEMKVNTKYEFLLRQDSVATLATAGVLGETFVNIDSTHAHGPVVENGTTLQAQSQPDIQDVVRSSQGTLQNIDVLLHRTDRILAYVESGQGSVGKFIYDPGLYDRLNTTVTEFQTLMAGVSQGRGTIGKLIADDELYRKANATVDKLNATIDTINSGKGTAGKLINDPALYNNANEAIAKANRLMTDINQGKGALGKFAADPAFAAKIDNTVTKLSALSDRLAAGEGTIGKLLNDPSVYNNTDRMLMESRALLQSIRENPKKYLTIKLRVF
jgi:phospholipid/cholesterol/gamma-HCH transport system substrate-binding protein